MFQPLEKWLKAFTKNAKRHGNETVTCNRTVGSEGLNTMLIHERPFDNHSLYNTLCYKITLIYRNTNIFNIPYLDKIFYINC